MRSVVFAYLRVNFAVRSTLGRSATTTCGLRLCPSRTCLLCSAGDGLLSTISLSFQSAAGPRPIHPRSGTSSIETTDQNPLLDIYHESIQFSHHYESGGLSLKRMRRGTWETCETDMEGADLSMGQPGAPREDPDGEASDRVRPGAGHFLSAASPRRRRSARRCVRWLRGR